MSVPDFFELGFGHILVQEIQIAGHVDHPDCPRKLRTCRSQLEFQYRS